MVKVYNFFFYVKTNIFSKEEIFMKIRLVKNLVCGCLLSVIIVLGISMCEGHGKKEATGTSDSVLKSKKLVEEYLEKKYKSKSDVKISAGSETKNYSQNYSQNVIRDYYNDNNGKKADIPKGQGLCWASANTSVLKFFRDVEPNFQEVGNACIKKAIAHDWVTAKKTAFDFKYEDELLSRMFDKYDIDLGGDSCWFSIYDKIVDEVDNGLVVVFAI